jgi:FkbM family methyltransferase
MISYFLARAAMATLRRVVPRLSPREIRWLAWQAMTGHFDLSNAALAEFMTAGLYAWHNNEYDIMLNGEGALLRRLAPFEPHIILDVGANAGEWTIAAAEALVTATVHAFEIVPATIPTLRAATAHLGERILVNPIGLSNVIGTVPVHTSPISSERASIVRGALTVGMSDTGAETIQASVTTGDAYLQERGIAHVDILKIDVEGAEMSVLHGFANTFARGAIDLVQFEYGGINLVTLDLLSGFYAFFLNYGYALGKVYPEGVNYKEYTREDENFIGPAFVACHRADMIEATRVH